MQIWFAQMTCARRPAFIKLIAGDRGADGDIVADRPHDAAGVRPAKAVLAAQHGNHVALPALLTRHAISN